MNISNNPIGQPNFSGTTPAANSDNKKATTSAKAPAATDVFEPSPEWTRLVKVLNQLPAVRNDRVEAAAQRLRQGYYDSPESIEKVAEILGESET